MAILTTTNEERGLIAILCGFAAQCEMPDKDQIPCTIVIKMNQLDYGTSIDLDIGGFSASGAGLTFAAAWKAMLDDKDFDRLTSDVIRPWLEKVTSLSTQERSLITHLRRRAALKDPYTIVIAVNGEGRPGEWEVYEETQVNGVGDTFAIAWDERF
jgi:hypothetical protein